MFCKKSFKLTGLRPSRCFTSLLLVSNSPLAIATRNAVIGFLQALTNDKLAYNKKTNQIDIVKRAAGKQIKFKAGTALIRGLVENGHTATINYDSKSIQINSGADPVNEAASENGTGSDVIVFFKTKNVQTMVSRDGKTVSEKQPLFHCSWRGISSQTADDGWL